ncbi:MAG: YifB family Mg chelatase-like AAA ATPase [Gammaproteobacteria bacterium]|nr:YifB family Mg chelatase-like AAA ATPase [Gammaproteobacteria bacterium]
MSIATIYSRAQTGMDAPLVSVEVHLSNGLPNFTIVGLPETAVRESKDRVRAAIINSNFEFPARRITVNLAPAELPKQGGRFDLPIAIGLLVASKQLSESVLHDYEFLGELSLSGELRKTIGILPAAHACQNIGCKLITSLDNKEELTPISHNTYFCASHLLDVCAHLNNIKKIITKPGVISNNQSSIQSSMCDIYGQQQAKRALCIAAAGQHHVLMIGSPGSGKSMLANRFPSLLSPLNESEMLETCSVYSIANVSGQKRHPKSRPFRSPHHTVSAIGLAGGGSHPQPGEISLAHNGVLFLDEFTEFDRRALEILREPIETGFITISRASAQIEFPARFQLIAAMNPCPNGCDINQYGQCRCSNQQLKKYRNKISAPLLDRIDLQVSVPKLPTRTLFNANTDSQQDWHLIHTNIELARALQIERQGKLNALLEGKQMQQVCQLPQDRKQKILEMLERLNISARAFHRILKTSRTIADLEQAKDITQTHIAEAMSYRQFDRLMKN